MKITIIEDDPDCFENYKCLLEERGHNVTVFDNADEVVQCINEVTNADVIVLDLMMQLGYKLSPTEAPDTGIAIYKRIREKNITVPIVVLTARAKGECWSEFVNDNRAIYLGKPVSNLSLFCKAIEREYDV